LKKALLQRPNSRWPTVFAFTAAAAIHISAVALASHYNVSTSAPGGEFAPVDVVVPGDDVPGPPPADIPVPRLPLPPLPTEFVESPIARRPLRKSSFAPVRPIEQAAFGGMRNLTALAVSAPRPDYPYEARRRRIVGSGVANLVIDASNGSVISAIMDQSTGDHFLDESALRAFRRWRFQPGNCPAKVRIPITFTMAGVSY
jgi:TonB family protein